MAENSTSDSLSRRAFFRRLGGGARSDDERTQDVHSASPVDEDEESGGQRPEAEQALSPEKARRQLEALGVTVMPLSEQEEQLQVQCKRVGDQFGQDELRLVEPLAPRIAWLDLARTNIEDGALEIIGTLTNLQRLYLQHTSLEGTGLSFLTKLDQLEYLNLFGTEIDDSALDHLTEIESLQTVYLWQTKVSTEGVETLREQCPDLSVEFKDSFFEE